MLKELSNLCRNSEVNNKKGVLFIGQLRNNIGTIEETVTTYTKDVERLARSYIKMKMNYKWLKEDLEQQGYIGLIEAYNNYDSTKTKGHFWSYASKFVKGRMVDFTLNYCNPIRPSKKINTLMLQIKKMNLFDHSLEQIAEKLDCSTEMAGQVVEYMAIRSTNSLDHSRKETDGIEDKHHVNVIRANLNEDDFFRVDILNGSSQMERKIIQMLIDGYSKVNIMEICEILEIELNAIIDKILVTCGYDNKTKGNRKEVLLMKTNVMNKTEEILEKSMEEIFQFVKIEYISSNPKNPRKDHSINTQQMQDIISVKGWEEPITCYKRGKYYIILAGHRRWHAAKELGEKTVPVFIVAAPDNNAEEMDRLGSLQSGQVEWTPYESAKNTYERWKFSGGNGYKDLARKMDIPVGRMAAKIRVYKYYPRDEIEEKLGNGMYSITMLDYIYKWIKRLNQFQPKFVDSIGEEFIRHQMLRKYENKCFNSNVGNDRSFVNYATDEQIFNFLSDTRKTLRHCQTEMLIVRSNQDNNVTQLCQMIGKLLNEINKLDWRDKKEAEKLLIELEKLVPEIEDKYETFQKGE